MIEVVSIYEDITKDAAFVAQNGTLSIPMFNRLSRRAEIRLIDWLKGDPAGQLPPEPWTTQVLKDFLSPFLEKFEGDMTSEGLITRPDNYYRFDNFFRLGVVEEENKDCDSEEESEVIESGIVITLLDGASFNNRVNSWVKGDRPTMNNPIAKQIGRSFQTAPKELGPVRLEYIRYPKFASISKTIDPVYQVEVPVAVNNYEWDEWAREPLVWFITDMFANRTSNKAMKEFNIATKKTVRE